MTRINGSFLILMLLPFVSSFILIQLADTTQEIITLNPIAYASVSNTGNIESQMLVFFERGVKFVSYFVFNTSGIPPGASIDSAVLKVKTQVVATPAWISAFCLPICWTDFSWENRPIGKTIDAKWVTTNEVWYSWEFSLANFAVLETSIKTKGLTIALESSLFGVDQTAVIFFYNDARLTISYTSDAIPPVLSNIKLSPSKPSPNDNIIASVSITDDESGVKETYLYYSIDNGSNWTKILMTSTGDSVYEATIPSQKEGTTVQYYFEVFDNALNKAESEIKSYTVRLSTEVLPYGFILIIILFGIPIIIGILIYRSRKKRKTEQIAFTPNKVLS